MYFLLPAVRLPSNIPSNKEDTSSHFHIFVGDLSNEVNDEVLLQAFSAFGSVSEARVMWDMKTDAFACGTGLLHSGAVVTLRKL